MFHVCAFCHTTDISTTWGSEWMSHERVPKFPRGGLPEHLPLHKQPVLWNFLLQSYIDCLVGAGLPYRLLKWRCTRVTESVLANSSTQKAFSTSGAAILLQWCQGRWRGADVTIECLEKIFIFPLCYYANCVSTTLTVLILHNFGSVYLFYSNPVFVT